MGKAGYVIGNIFGVIIALFGTLTMVGAFLDQHIISSWLAAFFAFFVYIIAAIIFFAASRAKPKKVVV